MLSRRSYLIGGAAFALPLISSCTIVPSLDYYQRYVILGAGDPPPNPKPRAATGPNGLISQGYRTKIGAALPIWLRAIQIEDVDQPAPLDHRERSIELSVVGDKGQATAAGTVNPRHCRTIVSGFNDRRLFFTASDLGVFRIRADFPDRRAISRSLSPFIIVAEA